MHLVTWPEERLSFWHYADEFTFQLRLAEERREEAEARTKELEKQVIQCFSIQLFKF